MTGALPATRSKLNASVDQLELDHLATNQEVGGSSPSGSTKFGSDIPSGLKSDEVSPPINIVMSIKFREVDQVVDHLLWEQGVAGSSPVFPTNSLSRRGQMASRCVWGAEIVISNITF